MKPRVLVTRAADQAGSLLDGLRAIGFDAISLPTVAVEIDRVVIPPADWVVATSANGIRALGEQPLRPARLAVVGPETAAVAANFGYHVDLVPAAARGDALVDMFPTGPGHAVVVQGDLALPGVVQGLESKGWQVTVLIGYRTSVGAMGDVPQADVVTFASPSAVDGFVASFGADALPSTVVTIGPTTSAACRAIGIDVNEQADPHTVAGMIEAVLRAVS